jgi:hypothetical protein
MAKYSNEQDSPAQYQRASQYTTCGLPAVIENQTLNLKPDRTPNRPRDTNHDSSAAVLD